MAFVMPYLLVNSNKHLCAKKFEKLRRLGCLFGFIFQILDDLVDRDSGVSLGNNILDYMGLERAVEKVMQFYRECLLLSISLELELSPI